VPEDLYPGIYVEEVALGDYKTRPPGAAAICGKFAGSAQFD
jgi:hypothetical protein